MSDYRIDPLELFEVSCLSTNPIVPHTAYEPPVIFLAGRAEGDYEDLLEDAVNRGDRAICIPGHDGSYDADGNRVPTGYPGFEAWKDELEAKMHWFPNPLKILSCVVRPGHEKKTNTREESEGFVLRAKEQGWKSAYVLAHLHQMPRLMCCLLLALETCSYSMTLIPMISESTHWDESVHGSLGQENKLRWQHIKEEYDRLEKYIRNGWAAPLSQLKEYLLNPDPTK